MFICVCLCACGDCSPFVKVCAAIIIVKLSIAWHIMSIYLHTYMSTYLLYIKLQTP